MNFRMESSYLTITPILSAYIAAAKIHGLYPYTFLVKPKIANTNERNLPVDIIRLLNSACDELDTYDFDLTFVEEYEWDKFDARVLSLANKVE